MSNLTLVELPLLRTPNAPGFEGTIKINPRDVTAVKWLDNTGGTMLAAGHTQLVIDLPEKEVIDRLGMEVVDYNKKPTNKEKN